MTGPHPEGYTHFRWGQVRVGVLARPRDEALGLEVLSERERALLEALPAHRRGEWLRGRHVGKLVARELLGPRWPPHQVEVLPGPWGEPRLHLPEEAPPPGVSLGHARELSVAAMTPRGRVGVDVEPAAPIPERLWHFFLSPAERARCAEEPGLASRLWVLKEALYKALCPPEPVPLRALVPEWDEGVLRLRQPVQRDFTFTLQTVGNHLLALVSS